MGFHSCGGLPVAASSASVLHNALRRRNFVRNPVNRSFVGVIDHNSY